MKWHKNPRNLWGYCWACDICRTERSGSEGATIYKLHGRDAVLCERHYNEKNRKRLEKNRHDYLTTAENLNDQYHTGHIPRIWQKEK